METPQTIEGPNWHIYTGAGAEDARKEGFIHITARSNTGPLIANVSDGKCSFLQRAGIKILPVLKHAQLIAAAPELLAASSELLDVLRDMPKGPQHDAMVKLCRAIAKAKGEEVPA